MTEDVHTIIQPGEHLSRRGRLDQKGARAEKLCAKFGSFGGEFVAPFVMRKDSAWPSQKLINNAARAGDPKF